MTYRSSHRFQRARLNQRGTAHYGLLIVAIFGLLAVVLSVVHSVAGQGTATSVIKLSGTGACLDDYHGNLSPDSKVDAWKCNGTASQEWMYASGFIRHASKYCLSVSANSKTVDMPVVLTPCRNAPGQVWLPYGAGLMNPNSNLCLGNPAGQPGKQLALIPCDELKIAGGEWSYAFPKECSGGEGEKTACFALKEWTTWQSPQANHQNLLNAYTDGAPYEAWCADFVSYVYKEAGFPFSAGETDGWDENDANNIQNMGFTIHDPSNYTPKAGDVAYFNYDGGHVEIVLAGGKNPTFIYGNSARTDHTTGNGQMAANTITSDGTNGKLIYYLSPN